MRGAVAERRRADFDIPAALPRVCSHICGADAGGSAISWGQWWFGARGFEADAANWVLDPFLAERILFPLRLRSATAHVRTHVMICVEANFPPASARGRPPMCERTFMHWLIQLVSIQTFRFFKFFLLRLRSATAHVWTHVMICVEANFPPAHVWTYLYALADPTCLNTNIQILQILCVCWSRLSQCELDF